MSSTQRQAIIELLATTLAENTHWDSPVDVLAAALVDGPLAPVIEALAECDKFMYVEENLVGGQLDAMTDALNALDPVWLVSYDREAA